MKDISEGAAKQRLRSYGDYRRAAERAANELRLWNARAVHGVDCEQIKEELRERIRECVRERIKIEEAIRVLPERYRLLMELRFIDGLTVEQTAEKMHIDSRWLLRQQAAAMRIIIIE